MALNPISFTEKVVSSFLRYQLTAYRFADSRLHAQMRELLSLEKTRATPLLKGPYVSVSRGFRAGATLAELAAEGVVHPALAGLAPFPSVWAHQEAAIRAIRSGRTTVVSTGTGSGKTEAFLYPIISRCLELRDAGAAPGIVAVLVYPMNALAEDQLGRLRDLLSGTGVPFGMYVGKTPERAADVSGVRLPKGSSREEYRRRLAKLRDEKRNEAVHPPILSRKYASW
ncbi:MAG TPA: DEAD/DEAH box helicase [Thermoanaerobaculia bacterium]|nr:DEAD/DEAH box helicase [Thermoanaerobaculia bacterium]